MIKRRRFLGLPQRKVYRVVSRRWRSPLQASVSAASSLREAAPTTVPSVTFQDRLPHTPTEKQATPSVSKSWTHRRSSGFPQGRNKSFREFLRKS